VVRVELTFRKGDETLTSSACGEGSDSGDKATAKAETAAIKYAVAHALCLAWGAEDPEASDPETGKPTAKSAQEPPTLSVKDVVNLIGEAATPEALVTVRKHVLALKDDRGYKGVVDMYKAREAELKKGGK
jgi:hypothetical protein